MKTYTQKVFFYSVMTVLLLTATTVVAEPPDRDKTPPIVSDVTAVFVPPNGATVTWTTDEPADSDIQYGIPPDLDFHGPYNSNLVTEHLISLTNLTPGTYSFCVISRDAENNRARECGYTFNIPDLLPPIISNIKATLVSITTGTITWVTDEVANGQIKYGSTHTYESITPLDATLSINHSVTLTGLNANTEYHIHIYSSDGSGNTAISSDLHLFTTLSKPHEPDITSPIISDVNMHEIGEMKIHISWMTNDPTDSQVEYGTTRKYGSMTVLDRDLSLSHEHFLTDILPDTTYHLRIRSRDYAGNLTISDDFNFTTLKSSLYNGNEEHPYEDYTEDPKQAINVYAIGLDKLIFISWKNPDDTNFAGVRIIRKSFSDPASSIYDGKGTTFSDSNLLNGQTYHYSIFSYDKALNYSKPIQFSITPYAERRHYHVLSTGMAVLSKCPTTRNLSIGDKGDDVGHIQELLSTDPTIYPEGLVTGYFGPLTQAAVKRIQDKFNIPKTGIVNDTICALWEEAGLTQLLIEKTDASIFSAFAHDLYFGMRSDDVKILQTYLEEQGFLPKNLLTGYFGTQTRLAVIQFQQANNITPAVGYVGPITRAKILEDAQITDL